MYAHDIYHFEIAVLSNARSFKTQINFIYARFEIYQMLIPSFQVSLVTLK